MTGTAVLTGQGIRVRGGADDAELAAVLALVALRGAPTEPPPSNYARWRRVRREALRRTGQAPVGPS